MGRVSNNIIWHLGGICLIGEMKILQVICVLLIFLFAETILPWGEGEETQENNCDWPMYMHDLHHTGRSACSGPHTNPHILWSIHLTKYREWFTTPLIYNGYLWTASDSNILFRVNLSSQEVKKIFLNWTMEAYLAIGNNEIYVNTQYISPPLSTPHKHYMYSLNMNGDILWKIQYNGSVSSPTISEDGTIYTVEENGSIYAISSHGNVKWKYMVYGYSSPVIGNDGTIYVGGYDSKKLYALDDEGKLKWSVEVGKIYASPSVGYDGTIYVSSDENFYAINPNGKIKWKISNLSLSTAAIGNNGMIYGVNVKYLYAISSGGKIKWKFKPEGLTPGLLSAPPVIDRDGFVYMTDDKGYVYALNSMGHLLWKLKLNNESITTSPIIGGNGILYILTINGKLYAIGGDTKDQQIYNNTLKDFLLWGGVIAAVASAIILPYYLYRRRRS